MHKSKESIAELLLDLGCVKLSLREPFLYASGLRGPFYCDNRKLLSHVEAREKVLEAFVEIIVNCFGSYDLIAGLATAGIAHAAFLSMRLRRPMIYIRPGLKEHGQRNQIEGDFLTGQKILLVEDLVNQGKSLGQAADAAQKAGLQSIGCLCIVDYQMIAASEVCNTYKLPLWSLTDFDSLVDLAVRKQMISPNEKNLLLDWRKSPATWQGL